jgi:ABC-type transport system substrate-binding protein
LAAVLVGADPAAASAASLVLAHPAGPIPRLACQAIAGQLAAIGLPVTLRELAPGEAPGANYDLLYVEFMATDSAEDAVNVLGTEGIAGQCSPAMLQALRAVERAADEAAKAAALQSVHRLAANELPVIPLWQLAEHFGHQSSVSGLGERPATLYQNVPEWQSTLRVPTE